MPTPPGRARRDAAALADNGGADGWELLDRVIADAPRHLHPGGRLIFTIFAFLGPKAAVAKVEAVGLAPALTGSEIQAFPRIGYERLGQIPRHDLEAPKPPGNPRARRPA